MAHLEQGTDFYIDSNGNYVFTARYLLDRGYCCENGCQHCPYGYSPSTDNDTDNA